MKANFEVGDMIKAIDDDDTFIIIKEHALYMSEIVPRFDLIKLSTQEIMKHCYLYNGNWYLVNKNLIDCYHQLEKIKNALNSEIIECNNYLEKRNDFGQTHRPDDPLELISYTRGKSIGLIIGRDKINNLLNSNEVKIDKTDAFTQLFEEIRAWNKQWEQFDRQEISKKPMHLDDFIIELKKKYELNKL
jgi:hypothetical protein